METALILISTRAESIDRHVVAALQATTKRLYLYLSDHEPQAPDTKLLTFIAHLYDLTAVESPCLDVVPLLPFAGWTAEKVANLPDLQRVFYTEIEGSRGKSAAARFLQLRGATLQLVVLQPLQPSTQPVDDSSKGARIEEAEPSKWVFPTGSQCPNHTSPATRKDSYPDAGAKSNEEGASEVVALGCKGPLAFRKVAVGGTFDHLHAGHRTLLAATALVATFSIYIGITADQLLVNKKRKEMLESYEQRQQAAEQFVLSVRPDLQILAGPLLDPKNRTAAAEDPAMEALVVSQETLPGGEAINEDRRQQGFEELALVVVNLVGLGSKALGGQKLSSTALREKAAEKQQQH